jgi:biotin carboxylase
MNKLIMVIAGSYWQIPVVKKIKSMGHKSLVVNLYPDSPAFAFADYSEVADILDKEKCLLLAKQYKIDGILSDESDIAMPTVAYIAESLNLPSLGSKFASLFTNKYLMRCFCEANDFPAPEYILCKNSGDAEYFFNKLKQPIIIKPLDSNSSRGVFKITNIEELQKYFFESMSFSKVAKAVLAERYIEGMEFTVDGIKMKDNHYSLAISQKDHYKHNANIANKLFFSQYNDDYDYDELRNINNSLIETAGLPDGCLTHSEYKFQEGKFYLIETAARGGGNLISSDIVPLLSGFDNYKYLINRVLNAENAESYTFDKAFQNRCAVLYFFDTPQEKGIVKDIQGLDYLENSPNVISYKLNFTIGDTVIKAENDSKRAGFYIAFAETKQMLINIIDEIDSRFKIIYS